MYVPCLRILVEMFARFMLYVGKLDEILIRPFVHGSTRLCEVYDKYSIFMRTRRDLLQFVNILVEMMYNARKLVETYDAQTSTRS